TVNSNDLKDGWYIGSDSLSTQFYSAPIQVEYRGERMMLVAEYNKRLFFVNYDRGCFSNAAGNCVGESETAIALPGHVVADMGEDAERVYVPLSEHSVIALNKGLYEEGWDSE